MAKKTVRPSVDDFRWDSGGGLEFCCGVYEVGHFDSDDWDYDEEKPISWRSIPEEVTEDFANNLGASGITLATTNSYQTVESRILRKAGFKKLKEFYGNHGEGYTVTLWCYTPPASVVKPKKTGKKKAAK